MNKKGFLKAIMGLPKAETNNPINDMIGINADDFGINADDFMSAVDRLSKVPDYNDLLKENQELKKQLESKYEKVGTLTTELLYEENTKLINQQKEFIKYLEDKINFYKINTQGYSMNLVEEILQKYKSIIGVSNETN